MKNVTPRLTLSTIACAFCMFSSAQTQMRNWVIPPKKVDVSLSVPAVVALPGAPSVTHESNGIYDAGNNLMFYVSDDQIYKPNGTSIGSHGNATPSDPSLNEIAIVPFLNNDACNNKKYYLS